MSRFLFLAARFYPYWALPVALVITELGMHFRRKRAIWCYHCWAMAAILVLGIGAWFVFRGDLNSDHWIRGAVTITN